MLAEAGDSVHRGIQERKPGQLNEVPCVVIEDGQPMARGNQSQRQEAGQRQGRHGQKAP